LKDTLSAAMTSHTVERADYVNMDPHRAPWIGVYRTRVKYDPRTLGRNAASWNGTVVIRLMVQQTSMISGEDCENQLEANIASVLAAVWSDETWESTVDMVTGMEIEYSYKEHELESIYFQWALITLTAEVSTG